MSLTLRRQAQLQLWAAKIDDLMAQQHLSQAQLALRMHTDHSTVCRLLKGSDAKASTYIAAFVALGVTHVEVVP
jgi:transcriptional regulator with XRE-family HTH domain